MTETGIRMRRPHWRDPRLGVGILLVVASVALGSWLFATADRSVEVYQARATLTPGQPVLATDLVIVRAQLDDVAGSYLLPSQDLDDLVISRTVPAGDLVPMSALGDAGAIDVRPVQIAMNSAMQDLVEIGSLVDLWVALPDAGGISGDLLAPELLVAAVEVGSIYEDTSVFAGGSEVQVQILIAESDLARVLAALTADGEITLVPVPAGSPS